MIDFGVKLSFSRSQMIFNLDLEANLGDYLTDRFIRRVVIDEVRDQNENNDSKFSFKRYLGGSFTFASVMEDFISGSRINFNLDAISWSKFFLFTGREYAPFFPNLNPAFSKISALEYSPEQVVSGECVSFSLRRRLNANFSLVASAAVISPRGPFWSMGIVAEDRIAGIRSIVSFNYQGNYCVGIKKDIGESGISLRMAAVVKGLNSNDFRWRDCFEIGLEM